MPPTFNPGSFESQVLQRLTALETELRLIRRNGHLAPALSGGLGGGVALSLIIVGRLLKLW